jgi:hypothetical protein
MDHIYVYSKNDGSKKVLSTLLKQIGRNVIFSEDLPFPTDKPLIICFSAIRWWTPFLLSKKRYFLSFRDVPMVGKTIEKVLLKSTGLLDYPLRASELEKVIEIIEKISNEAKNV